MTHIPIFPLRKKKKLSATTLGGGNEGSKKEKRHPTNKSSRRITFWAHRNFLLPHCVTMSPNKLSLN
jgi:hypothetical protein